MLPGVEAARRRRVHQSSSGSGAGSGSSSGCSSGIGSSPSSRRSSFSLFSPNSSASFLGQTRSRTTYDDEDNWKLGPLAREAKERLDGKLRAQSKSFIVTSTTTSSSSSSNGRSEEYELRREVFGSKKNGRGRGAKRLMIGLGIGWSKLIGWKSGDQLECAVCLDEFKVGDNLVNLPCAHTFHSNCLLPWLHTNTNAHCPCCRTSIFSS